MEAFRCTERCLAERDGAIFRCGDAMHARRSFVHARREVRGTTGCRFGCGEIGFELIKLGLPASARIPFLRFAVSAVVSVRNSVGRVAEIRWRVNGLMIAA